MERKTPQSFEIYRLTNGELYQIITVACYTETGEDMVVYQALQGDYKCYVRPVSLFGEFELLDRHKNNNSKEIENVRLENEKPTEISSENNMSKDGIAPEFLDFLDANTYREKMILLRKMRNQIDDKMINNLAISLDLSVEEGPMEDRFNSLMNGLGLLERFECNRLR